MTQKVFKFLLLLTLIFLFSSWANYAFAQTNMANTQCWSKSDCLSKSCGEACFEESPTVCGEGRGYCYAEHIPTELEIKIPGFDEPIHDPAQYFSKIYEWGISVTGILAGIMIMIGGLLYLTAGGSPEKVSNAKSYISNALVGLILTLTSYFLLQTINPALLSLKFPKVKLIQAVTPFPDFCEDLLENSDIKVTPEVPGKTLCGDIGIPQSISGTSNVPSKCMYGICQDAEKACLPLADASLMDKPAGCFSCAGKRLDGALAGISTNPLSTTSTDIQTPRRYYGQKTCEALTPLSKDSTIYFCEFLDTDSALGENPMDSFVKFCSDFGTAVMVADIGRGLALRAARKLAPPIARGRLGTLGAKAAPSAGVKAGNVAVGVAIAGEAGEALGEYLENETIQNISGTVSVVAECAYGGIVAFTNPLTGIIGGTYTALREFFSEVLPASRNPEKFFGVEGVCAIAKIDCNDITSCEDYAKKITFKGQESTTYGEILAEKGANLGGFLVDTDDLKNTYCNSNPCQLPLDCTGARQKWYYWNPGGAWSAIGTASEAIAGGSDPDDHKCVPLQMDAINFEATTFEPNPHSTSGTGRSLAQEEGITRDMIYPIVKLIPAGRQGKGQLCRTDADCATGLKCRGEPVSYKNVKEETPEQRNYIQITKEQSPHTVNFQRCQ